MENNSLCTAAPYPAKENRKGAPYPAKENRKGAPYAIFIWRVMNDTPSWGVNVGVMINSRRYLDNY